MELGQIVYMDEYSKAWDFALQNGYLVEEIEGDEKGRRFQIVVKPEPTQEEILKKLRWKREEECFSIINRGQLWYNTLNQQQLKELKSWYNDWLNVTETLQIPTKPEWLD